MIYITSPMAVRRLAQVQDTVIVLLTYRRYYEIGFYPTGMRLRGTPADRRDTVKVVRLGPLGWRIDTLPPGVHLLPRTALDSIGLDSASRVVLTRLASSP